MADEKQPVEKAVELFVYAPVGMACYVRDMLPSMMGIFVARGKREVSSHRPSATPPAPSVPPMPPIPPIPPEVKRRIDESVGAARYMAEGSFGVARDVAGSGLGVARDVAGSALSQLRTRRSGADTGVDTGVDNGVDSVVQWEAPQREAAASPESPPEPPPEPPPDASWATDVPPSESLPIPDYDQLSASQVVERLAGLDRESLDAIRRYETEHRGRNTILGKIAQLT